jgi:hypothetical protein
MSPNQFTCEAGTGPFVTRKIAKPSKKHISAKTRESVQSLINSSQLKKFVETKRKPILNERRVAIEAEEEELAAYKR